VLNRSVLNAHYRLELLILHELMHGLIKGEFIVAVAGAQLAVTYQLTLFRKYALTTQVTRAKEIKLFISCAKDLIRLLIIKLKGDFERIVCTLSVHDCYSLLLRRYWRWWNSNRNVDGVILEVACLSPLLLLRRVLTRLKVDKEKPQIRGSWGTKSRGYSAADALLFVKRRFAWR
jgi:hypothetical protein